MFSFDTFIIRDMHVKIMFRNQTESNCAIRKRFMRI